jgi:hypothetical protein
LKKEAEKPMETTIVNPKRRLPPRGKGGRFRAKKRATARSYRRNETANENPRRRGRKRRYSRRRNEVTNPRRYRRRARHNPDGFSIGRFFSAGLGGVGIRLLARKIGGIRGADGKLTGTHYITMAAGIYVAPAIAEWLGADAREQSAAQDGASAVAAQFLVDQHADEFAGNHLLAFTSPAPTGSTEGLLGMGDVLGSIDNPLPPAEYERLAGMGQIPGGGAFVRAPDGSIWHMPTPIAGFNGMEGMGAGEETRVEIPEHARPGDIIKDSATNRRYKLGTAADGSFLLFPVGKGTAGMSAAMDRYSRSVD